MTILISTLGTKAFGFLFLLWQAATPSASEQGGQEINFTEMVKHMGPVAITVVIILLIMSVHSIAIMVERYLTYSAAKKQSREFAPRVAQALKNNRVEANSFARLLRADLLPRSWCSASSEYADKVRA